MSSRARVAVLLGSLLTLLALGLGAAHVLSDTRTVPGLLLGGRVLPTMSDPTPEVRRRVEAWLDEEVVLEIGPHTERRSRRELGALIDSDQVAQGLLQIGHGPNVFSNLLTRIRAQRSLLRVEMQPSIDEPALRTALTAIALGFDRPAVEPQMENGAVVTVPEDGRALDVEASFADAQRALLQGEAHVVLVTRVVPPSAALPLSRGIENQIISSFVTRYRQRGDEGPRAHNVRTAARALDGAIIPAQGRLSFNERVGERSEGHGYEIAHVIYDGEMIDGIGGGVCQVASTLHAAALLGGLAIVRHAPHSRPSTYIPMGLDATVAWPDVDLVIENPLTVPVTVRAVAQGGQMQVDLWARARPREVTWRRNVLARSSFDERIVEDPLMTEGTSEVTQEGAAGYVIDRVRTMQSPAGPVVERVRLTYPPTDRITHRGPLPPEALTAPPVEVAPLPAEQTSAQAEASAPALPTM